MRAARFPRILILVFAFGLIGAACREERPEPKLETHRTIPSPGRKPGRRHGLAGAAAGELDVRGGAGGRAMKGSFITTGGREPRIDYQVSGGVSRLVEQRRMGPAFGRVRNNWNVDARPERS